MSCEVWTIGIPDPITGPPTAQRLESAGYDGILVVDSQNLAPDSFVGLTLMAAATETLGIGTGVTNPVTRHPAALAGAATSIHAASDGRMSLGIGRGDSALFHIGREPAPIREFQPFLERLCGYVRGEEVDLDGHPSRLRWLRHAKIDQPVPIDVAATGPKVIALSAVLADRLTFAVGANPERLAWAIDLARSARTSAGLDPDALKFGAYLNCAPHPDVDIAVELLRGPTSTFAHFSGMSGSSDEVQSPEDREQFESLHEHYDRPNHSMARSAHAQQMDADFIKRFAVVGPPDHCNERLRAVIDTGIDRIVFTFASFDSDAGARRLSSELFVNDVMPVVQGRA